MQCNIYVTNKDKVKLEALVCTVRKAFLKITASTAFQNMEK